MAAPSPDAVAWAPHPGGQEAFLSCPIPEILLEGNRGGGKTEAVLLRFWRHVRQGWGLDWRGIIFRREYKHLDDLVVKSKRLFHRIDPQARFIHSKDAYKWVWPTGEELLFRAAADGESYWDHHGHEYPFIHFEELQTWPTDDLYDAMKACWRSPVPGIPRYYGATANPFGVGHGHVKERFVDPGPPGTVIQSKDGPRVRIRLMLEENRTLLSADPRYRERLAGIANDALREAWLYGNWDIVVGGFLQGHFDHERHVVDDFDIPLEWTRWRSMDWGFGRPYSIGWYAMSPEGVIYRYRELYGWGGKANVGSRESAEEVSRKVLDMEALERKAGIEFRRNPADSAIWAEQGGMRRDGREVTVGELFRRSGVPWQPVRKGPGSRRSGAQVVIHFLQQDRFRVLRSCQHWLRTVPYLMPDEDDWEDVDTEQEDHAWDETRYSLVSRHRPAEAKGKRKPDGPKPGTFDWLVQSRKKRRHPLLQR